jgi:hypothetical protein
MEKMDVKKALPPSQDEVQTEITYTGILAIIAGLCNSYGLKVGARL